MTKKFYGVYLSDRKVAGALDLIRFLAEPDAIRPCHITLRGPVHRTLSQRELDALNVDAQSSFVQITEPAKFFSRKQNTVYLGVELGALSSLWRKPDYPDGEPHLTLYDGPDQSVARELFTLLGQYKWDMPVSASPLRVIDKKRELSQTHRDIALMFVDAYSTLLGITVLPPAEEIPKLPLSQRLHMIQDVIFKLRLPALKMPQAKKAKRVGLSKEDLFSFK